MNLEIDRLTLRMPGLAPTDANRLAVLVGQRLSLVPAGSTAGALDSVRIAVPANPGETLDALAQRIVDQLVASMLGAIR